MLVVEEDCGKDDDDDDDDDEEERRVDKLREKVDGDGANDNDDVDSGS
jgi:hypothetical protein